MVEEVFNSVGSEVNNIEQICDPYHWFTNILVPRTMVIAKDLGLATDSLLFFLRWDIPVNVKSQVYVLNQSHAGLVFINLFMVTYFVCNCEPSSGQMMACWWRLTEAKHVALSKLIKTSVVCDWFNAYTCDSLSGIVLCNGWSQLYMQWSSWLIEFYLSSRNWILLYYNLYWNLLHIAFVTSLYLQFYSKCQPTHSLHVAYCGCWVHLFCKCFAATSAERTLFENHSCTSFLTRFTKAEYNFGIEDTTFYVYVYDFRPPLWIQISFSQYPKLNLQQFFITFSTWVAKLYVSIQFSALFYVTEVPTILLLRIQSLGLLCWIAVVLIPDVWKECTLNAIGFFNMLLRVATQKTCILVMCPLHDTCNLNT